MRVLLDERIEENLRHEITGHDSQTCRYACLKGLTNGQLLAAAEKSGFHVPITVDKNMQYQQNFDDRGIGVIILDARTTNFSCFSCPRF